jgi:hypothetical protein
MLGISPIWPGDKGHHQSTKFPDLVAADAAACSAKLPVLDAGFGNCDKKFGSRWSDRNDTPSHVQKFFPEQLPVLRKAVGCRYKRSAPISIPRTKAIEPEVPADDLKLTKLAVELTECDELIAGADRIPNFGSLTLAETLLF